MNCIDLYQQAISISSDIVEHLPVLHKYASVCEHVTEFGVRHCVSTAAFLAARPKILMSYDYVRYPEVDQCELAAVGEVAFTFVCADVCTIDIAPTDLLFIDTQHTQNQIQAELIRHSDKVARYMIFHDTETFGLIGEDGGPGLWPAIARFLRHNRCWRLAVHYPNCHGMTILERST